MKSLPTFERHQPSRVVGILGGMGPAATADFYSKLIRLTPAMRDQDHLRVVMWADPTVPSRQEALLHGGEDPAPSLRNGVRTLVACGAEIVVCPCNTAHAYLPAIVADEPVQFINMVTATVDVVRRAHPGCRVGVLATDGALAAGLYQNALAEAGLGAVLLSERSQASLMELVDAVKAGDAGSRVKGWLKELLDEFLEHDVDAVIAGCTEISMLLDGTRTDGIRIVDPAVALARATVGRSRGA